MYYKKNYNASHVQPLGRHDDGQRTAIWHQTVMREGYAKIAARPKGLYHAFVSHKACIYETLPHFHNMIHTFANIVSRYVPIPL